MRRTRARARFGLGDGSWPWRHRPASPPAPGRLVCPVLSALFVNVNVLRVCGGGEEVGWPTPKASPKGLRRQIARLDPFSMVRPCGSPPWNSPKRRFRIGSSVLDSSRSHCCIGSPPRDSPNTHCRIGSPVSDSPLEGFRTGGPIGQAHPGHSSSGTGRGGSAPGPRARWQRWCRRSGSVVTSFLQSSSNLLQS